MITVDHSALKVRSITIGELKQGQAYIVPGSVNKRIYIKYDDNTNVTMVPSFDLETGKRYTSNSTSLVIPVRAKLTDLVEDWDSYIKPGYGLQLLPGVEERFNQIKPATVGPDISTPATIVPESPAAGDLRA